MLSTWQKATNVVFDIVDNSKTQTCSVPVCVRSQVGEDSSNRKFLVSRLFDVAEGSTLEESSSSCIRLEWNKGIVGHVAATGQPLNIKNAYEVRMSHCAAISPEAGEAHLMV